MDTVVNRNISANFFWNKLSLKINFMHVVVKKKEGFFNTNFDFIFQLFGLEQKDQWCTQCKWKKACARFT